MLSVFFSEPEKQTATDKICESIMAGIIDTINKEFPNAEEGVNEIIKQCKLDFQEQIHTKTKDVDAKHVYDFVTTQVLDYLASISVEPNKMQPIAIQVKDGKELITLSNSLTDKFQEFDKIERFRKKINASKKYQRIFKSIKSVVRILALGETGVGKTALVKSLFDLKNHELKLKGGVESDTEFVKTYEYKINEIILMYTDSPGFFDTRGSDKAKKNMKQIMNYIENNEIDIILWVSKIGDLVHEKHCKLLKKLTKAFGVKVWKKTVIVLTHANELPPDEYYENDDEEEVDEITAWKSYTEQKKYNWEKVFDKIQKKYDTNYNPDSKITIPVALVENSIRRSNRIQGVRTLRDGTPFMEDLIKKIFTIIKKDKAPIIFLSMVGNLSNTALNSTDLVLTEQQQSLNNATDEMFDNVISNKKCTDGSWCWVF